MTRAVFLEVVELRTKVASVFPFLISTLFCLTYFRQINWLNTLLFLVGMLAFDMATTAINNYMDYHKAASDVYKHQENVIGREGLAPKTVQRLIFLLIGIAAVSGLVLALRSGWLLLFLGGGCCFIGIFYTFGPIPLSRMPLGELFSGVTMGLGIFAMVVYLNTYQQKVFFLQLDLSGGHFALTGNLWQVAAMILASLPLVFTIADIMLANNLRDLERDIENQRYTLVYYIGRKHGVTLFQSLMYGSYGAILLGGVLHVFHWPILVTLLTLPVIRKNLQEHKASLPQPKSFGYSIKNMVLFNSSYAAGLLLSLLVIR